jgi:hypothetical protein
MTKNYIKQIKDKTTYKYKEINFEYIHELRSFLEKIQEEDEGMIILAFQRLKDIDTGGVASKDLIIKDVLEYNNKHLELGGNYLYAKLGLAITCAPNFFKMGELTSSIIINALDNK